ncbi:MAG: NifU family protein [Luteibaculaceae bacterium]
MEVQNTVYPTSVYAEYTPNPATMKFVANRNLFQEGDTAEYFNINQTRGSSALAERLFNFPFVKSVFFRNNFLTITKIDYASWDDITLELREFIREFLVKNEFAVAQPPMEKAAETASNGSAVKKIDPIRDFSELTDTEQKIVSILEDYVKPAVEADGGAIEFHSLKEGVVTLILKGSCSGCPSSTITLKSGIENMLKSMVPEVSEVIALED